MGDVLEQLGIVGSVLSLNCLLILLLLHNCAQGSLLAQLPLRTKPNKVSHMRSVPLAPEAPDDL